MRKQKKISQKELKEIREKRKNRFRILACIDETEKSDITVKHAAKIGNSPECDLIIAYIRTIDQDLRTEGLQVRVARQNMLDWGLELPGIKYLKNALEILKNEGVVEDEFHAVAAHTDVWGDPLGDNKIEYRQPAGNNVVLKLKTAPDPASGILDQYDLGPYNLIILGAPSHWKNPILSWFGAATAEKILFLSPCSIMITRETKNKKGILICINATRKSFEAACQISVLAKQINEPITLFSVAQSKKTQRRAQAAVDRVENQLSTMNIQIQKSFIAIGNPAKEILKNCNKFAIVSVCSQRHSWIERLLHKSVAYQVIKRAQTSVINVR